MTGWLLSIVGVVSVGVLLEIMLSEGKTSKYIKGVFSLCVVLVIVSPLPKFFNKDFDVEDFFNTEISSQQTFQNSLNQRRNVEREKTVETELCKKGVDVEKVKIFYLQNQFENIDVIKIYCGKDSCQSDIKSYLQNKFKIKEDQIKIYFSGD